MLPPMLRALRHRNYRLLFFGQLISLCGVWMQITAQGWLVLRLTDSPLWLGLIAAAQSLPVLVISLPAGALADRAPKRLVLLAVQTIAMLSALLLAMLLFTGMIEVWHVLVAALVGGIVSAVENTTRQAFTIELVGREDLMNAIALDSMVFNGTRIIGPAVAGVVVAAIGEAAAFLFNGLSYLGVIAGLLLMRLDDFRAPARSSSAGGDLRAGIAYILGEPKVRLLLLQVGLLAVFGLAYVPLLPSFARDVLGGDALIFGLVASANATGALCAALMIALLGDRLPRVKLMTIALLSYSIFLGGFTLARDLLPAVLLIAGVGWSGITAFTISNTLIQAIVPDSLRGRVMSVYVLIVMGLSQVSGLMLAGIAELVGDVALTVGVWTSIGWCLLVAVRLAHTKVQLDLPAPVQNMEPGVRREA
ncbi:MAG TPA: MFS transporter [Roseiflexaceae bacterium]|nr:MFS transporter [Roseiflexaceae bacterium]